MHLKEIGGGRGTADLIEQRGGRSEPPMECLVFLGIETVTAGDLLQATGGATFSFPLSSGMAAVLSETLPSGPLAINNRRMPVRAAFRSQIHSTLHQHFVLGRASLHPGTLGEGGCWTSLPKQHPETAPRDRLGGRAATAELWGRCVSWSEPGTASLR